MNHFRLGWGRFELQHDVDYGRYNLTGWSIVWDGSFHVQLEPSLVKSLWIGLRSIRVTVLYWREEGSDD